jgi:hypothetical protein
MRAKAFQYLDSARAAAPYLWGFAAAAALDHVVDVETLFLPVMAGAVVASVGALLLRRAGR